MSRRTAETSGDPLGFARGSMRAASSRTASAPAAASGCSTVVSGGRKCELDGRERGEEVRRLGDVVRPHHGEPPGRVEAKAVGGMEHAECLLIVPGEHRVDIRAHRDDLLERRLAARGAPVALDEERRLGIESGPGQDLERAVAPLPGLLPREGPRHARDASGAALEHVPGGDPPDLQVVDADRRHARRRHAAPGHHEREGQLHGMPGDPVTVRPDARDGPDDAVHPARGQCADDRVGVERLGVVDQREGDRVAEGGRLALEPDDDLRRAVVAEAVGDDADGLAAAAGEAACQQVRCVPRLLDDAADPFGGLGSDVRAVVQDARDGLHRDARSSGDLPHRDPGRDGHEPTSRRGRDGRPHFEPNHLDAHRAPDVRC
jgi:hypothetical protein